MGWMNQTKIRVPAMAKKKAKKALPHRADLGMKSIAIKMPNRAEEMAVPVVGETSIHAHRIAGYMSWHSVTT